MEKIIYNAIFIGAKHKRLTKMDPSKKLEIKIRNLISLNQTSYFLQITCAEIMTR